MHTAIIIQARMTSTRLPGKILLPVANLTFLEIQINRLRLLNIPIIIATTTNDSDNLIVEFAKKNNLEFYRGSEENVLERYYLASKKYNVKHIVRITSDCPLIDINCINTGLKYYKNLNTVNAFVSNTIERTYPRGFDFEIFSFIQLENAYLNAIELSDKEHVTPYIWKNKNGQIEVHQIKNNIDYSNFRLTLDTDEDYILLKKLIEEFDAHEKNAEYIYQILNTNPELVSINSHIEQKKIDNDTRFYKPLHNQIFKLGNYTLVPIRDKDKYEIKNWRNDQIVYLRQDKPLTDKEQEIYFSTVVNSLFQLENPPQLLFSFLENNELIGYGGLVHINWDKKTAEISFLTPLERANNAELFVSDWCNYLKLIKQVADIEMNFNSIFTYAYDLRPLLYEAILQSGFKEKERIKNAVSIENKTLDVLIHEFNFETLTFRMANMDDLMHYYHWANDKVVRENSYNQEAISLHDHTQWFETQIENSNNFFYMFFNKQNQAVGQVRISVKPNETIIGVSVDEKQRGKGYSSKMIALASKDFILKNHGQSILAYIKTKNVASYQSFLKAGFVFKEKVVIENNESYVLKFASKI